MYIKYYSYIYTSYMSVSMTRKIDLNELKEKYIGNTFGWLTVLDAYKDSTKGRYFSNVSANVVTKYVSHMIK